MPRRATPTSSALKTVTNKDIAEAMAEATASMIPKKCKHVPKEEELMNTDCDECIRDVEITAMRELLAYDIDDEEIYERVIGKTSTKKELPPLPTELKISIKKHRGYRGWFWDVEKAYTYMGDGEIWWRKIEGAYSITKRGARWASHRAVKKYQRHIRQEAQGLNANEYFVDENGYIKKEPGSMPSSVSIYGSYHY